MGRKRVLPSLLLTKGKYYCTDVYLPNGKRSTIGFGTTEYRTVGEITVAFEKWIELYQQQPHKVLPISSGTHPVAV